MIDYNGQIVLVTGAGSGIGRALACAFAARGAALVLADRDAAGLAESARMAGGQSWQIVCDLADPAAPATLMAQAWAKAGKIDLVCSNAGIMRPRRLLRENFETADAMFAVNFYAGLRLAQAYVPLIEAAGMRGRLMLTGSENSLSVPAGVAGAGLGIYGASKHAVMVAAEWLRAEAAGGALDVHVLLPGGVYTPLISGALPDPNKLPPDLHIISPAQCAEIALRGLDLGLFYIPTHKHIGDDIVARFEGVRAALVALGVG